MDLHRGRFWQFFAKTRIRIQRHSNSLLKSVFFLEVLEGHIKAVIWSFFQHSSVFQFCFWQSFVGFVFGNFLPGSFLVIFCWFLFWKLLAWFVFVNFLPGSFLAIFCLVCFWQYFALFVFGNFLPGSFLTIFCLVCFW